MFGRDATWTKLASLLGQGARIRSTRLTEHFDFEAFNLAQSGQSVLLFALDKQGRLRVYSSNDKFNAEPGWTLITLCTSEVEVPVPDDVDEEGAEPA